MLGKQAWRLLTNPDSLVSRVFEAKYYAGMKFTNAKLGINPSFVWRSIYETKDFLVSGLRYRVGMGLTINVWNDAWLPDRDNPSTETICEQGLEEIIVNCLLRDNSPVWDEDIVKSLFNTRDYKLITSIPLSRNRVDDVIMWKATKNGVYSVKSGYQCLFNAKNGGVAPAPIDWNGVWRLQISPKVKNFLWRALTGVLPTRLALRKRHIDVESRCPVCNNYNEDVFHILVRCNLARQVWRAANFGEIRTDIYTFTNWWNDFKLKESRAKLELAAYILWAIWRHRNDVVWHGKPGLTEGIVIQAKSLLHQWREAKGANVQKGKTDIVLSKKWIKPAAGRLKINVDASVRSDKCGYAGVARSSDSNFVAAVQGITNGEYDPLLAESIDLREVLSWIKQKGLQRVDIELDAQMMVMAINSNSDDRSICGLVINDCRVMLQDLNDCKVSFARRTANLAAHELARNALENRSKVNTMISC